MSRNRRAVMLGGLGIAIAWLALRAIPGWVHALQAKEESVEQQSALLAAGRGRLRRLPVLEDSIRVVEELADALPTILLAGQESETATVDLMRRVRELLASPAVSISGFEQSRFHDNIGPLVLAAVAVRLETDFEGLIGALAAIENDAGLAVESLRVTATAPHSHDDVPEHLTATLSVSGWYQGGDVGEVERDFSR